MTPPFCSSASLLSFAVRASSKARAPNGPVCFESETASGTPLFLSTLPLSVLSTQALQQASPDACSQRATIEVGKTPPLLQPETDALPGHRV